MQAPVFVGRIKLAAMIPQVPERRNARPLLHFSNFILPLSLTPAVDLKRS